MHFSLLSNGKRKGLCFVCWLLRSNRNVEMTIITDNVISLRPVDTEEYEQHLKL